MPKYSETSLNRLNTCNPKLKELFNEVVKTFDCSILCGYRGKLEQNTAFKNGASGLEFPKSKHNKYLSSAIDVAPYPIDWADIKRFYLFAGYVFATAERLGIKIRWGGDWDGDGQTTDNSFNDLVHFELV